MPNTIEAVEAGERLNTRAWWESTVLADLADGETSDVNDPVVLTCTRGEAAKVGILLAFAAMTFDLEYQGPRAGEALDLAMLVGDQLFPATEAEVQQAIEAEHQHDDAAEAEGLIGI